MSDNTWPAGYDRIVLDEVDSTSAHAARIADTLGGPTWILAHRQSAAHGRRGRPWAMLPGNFAATLVMRPDAPPEAVALRSFVAALALDEAFVAVTGRAEAFALKWPNDVLLNGGKVAGILLESTGVGQAVRNLAIGIGVNLASAPKPDAVEPEATRPVSLQGETGVAVPPEEFLGYLAPAFARYETMLATYGFDPIRKAWLARAARIGQPVIARTTQATHEGIFVTLDETGAIVLQTTEGRIAVPAAEIYF